MSSSIEFWTIFLDVGVGLGVLLVGIGVFIACLRLSGVLARLIGTLDEVDRHLSALAPPITQTLSHVGGIADTADLTLARLGGVVGQLETVAGNIAKTSSLAQDALAPSIVNLGSTVTGVTAGLRRLTKGKEDNATTPTPDSNSKRQT